MIGQTRMELRVIKVEPPPPPQQESGDSVEIDRATGDIVATSRGVTFRLPSENDMAPDLTVSFRESGGNLVYDYKIANGPMARLTINSVGLLIPKVAITTVTPPVGWIALKGEPVPPTPPCLLFLKKEDNARQLTAGASMNFVVVSTDLPGLIIARFLPLSKDRKAGERTHGGFIEWASPWVREKLLQADTQDRHEIQLYTIGPKIAVSDDGLSAIQSELRAASGLAVFSAIGSQLLQASYLKSLAEIRAVLQSLGATQLQRDFVSAIQWRAGLMK